MSAHLAPALLILLLSHCAHASTLNHDYELSRGRNMWTGIHRGVHYFDHFKLLTHRMSDIRGAMTSSYPFIVNDEWALSFALKKTGPAKSLKDGFMLLLSSSGISPTELDDVKSYRSFTGSMVG